jgi:AcrR family transcriptional regulator
MPSAGASPKGLARRREILSTAVRVIAERGYPGATIRGIGRELGIEPAHILYYFGSREQLLIEVLKQWDAGNLANARPDADALELYVAALRSNIQIRGLVHLYLSFAAEAVDPAHPAHSYFSDRFALTVRELSAAIAAGQDRGLIARRVDPVRAARSFVALADGLQLQALVDPTIDVPTALEASVDEMFISGRREYVGRPSDLSR